MSGVTGVVTKPYEGMLAPVFCAGKNVFLLSHVNESMLLQGQRTVEQLAL